ncbi:MAG: thiolase family protein, partial [Kordiimonas sp.]
MGTRGIQNSIAVAVPVSLSFGRFSDVTTPVLFARALRMLLARSGLDKNEIDGLAVSSFSLAPDPAVALTRSLGLSLSWFEDVSVGGASGCVALSRASRAVENGDASIVACIAADTNPKDSFKNLISDFSRASKKGVYPYGAGGPTSVFALLTQQYMRTSGAGREDFAAICSAQRRNAENVAHAVHKKPLSIGEYLEARMIAEPLCLYDCVMPVTGAEAFLVMSESRAISLGLPYTLPLSNIEAYNAFSEDSSPLRGGWELGRERLFNEARLSPDDMDIIETYDDYPAVSVLQLEELGILPVGEGAKVLAGNKQLLARINTSGGQLSCGQAGAAGGFLGLVEAIRQLTGQAEGWQQKDARH